jgi:hypothetical protein
MPAMQRQYYSKKKKEIIYFEQGLDGAIAKLAALVPFN